MKTRRLGYHHLILPDGSRQDMAVVVVDAAGHYLSHHPLQSEVTGSAASFIEVTGSAASFIEEPFVEWIGGTLDLTT